MCGPMPAAATAVRVPSRVWTGDRLSVETARVPRRNRQFLISEHVRSDDSVSARWQDRLAGTWSVFGQERRCNRRTLSSIEWAFGGVQVDRELWQGMPAVVRPSVIGWAVSGNEVGRAVCSTDGYEMRPRAVESGG